MPVMITDSAALAAFCEPLRGVPFVTLDTEFIRERTYWPQLCLIQLAGPEAGHEAAIDPLVPGLDLAPVWRLLEDPATVKVMHAGKQDIEIFLQKTGKIPSPVFDTQIAAMVCGMGEQVGYEAIVNRLLGLKVDKSQQFTDWARRPLTERQVEYAILDVVHLRDVYLKLREKMSGDARQEWMAEETRKLTDPATYRVEPGEAWLRFRKKSGPPHAMARLRALAEWRERQAQARDVPRGRLIKDDPMTEMALTNPTTLGAIKRVRTIGNHLSERDLNALLGLMAEASALPLEACPKPEPRVVLSPAVEQARDLLKLLLKLVCDKKRVSPRMVADLDDLTAIAGGERDHPIFVGWRHELFGIPALALLEGRLAFRFDPAKGNVAFEISENDVPI